MSDPVSHSLQISQSWRGNATEDLIIRILSDLHATVETNTHKMNIRYIEDESEPNGQIEIDQKAEQDGDVDIWVSVWNGVPREVIVGIVRILDGDEQAEQYRVMRNSSGRVIENNTDPEGFLEPGGNTANGNNNSNLPSSNNGAAAGGRRRKRKTRRGKGRRV